MGEELLPPVVAVVVTSNPREWFEACLGSLRAQDYPNLAVLVADDASAHDITATVAAIVPKAVVRRRHERAGYAATANEALLGVKGAQFLLFCHDDVVLSNDTVRTLVEEAFRLNAGVAGPKLVDAADPRLLSQVGLGMTRLGAAVSRVEPGELDQSQHDEAREVFAVSGACMLVRTDLFEALGGFDESMTLFGEDVDLCWRAQLAGARVAVAPAARVAHHGLAAAGRREVDDVALLLRRHELRSVLKNTGAVRLLPRVMEALGLAAVGVCAGLFRGERSGLRLLWRTWAWNLAERSSLRDGRRQLREIRHVSDRALMGRMTARSVIGRGRDSVTSRGEQQGSLLAGGHRRRALHSTAQLVAMGCLVLLALAGLRDVLFARLPLIGQSLPMPNGLSLLGQYFGGRQVAGTVRPAAPGYFVVGLLGAVFGNSTALAWKVIEIGSLVLGAVGVARLCHVRESSRSSAIGVASFLFLPFGWNAIATGSVQAAVAIGLSPFLLGRLLRAGDLRRDASSRGALRELAPFGLLLTLLVALSPAAVLGIAAVGIALVVACLIVVTPAAAAKVLALLTGGLLIAFVCLLPWSATWFQHGAHWSAFSGAVPALPLSPASLLRGHLGPVGAWWGTWGIIVAAACALVICRKERSRLAFGLWLSALGSVGLAWAGSEGWLWSGGGATAVIVAPAAGALAGLCGLTAAGFDVDVIVQALGWRHLVVAAAAVCLAFGSLPVLSVIFGGHGELPSAGFDTTLTWPRSARPYLVLWIGDPRSLPGNGWQLQDGVGWYLATDGRPGASQVWPSPSAEAYGRVGTDIQAAQSGSTAELGTMLARANVREIVVPVADAPELPGSQTAPLQTGSPQPLVDALEAQEDLVEQPVIAGALVFDNADWSPVDSRAHPELVHESSFSPLLRTLGLVGAGVALGLSVVAAVVFRRRTEEDADMDDRVPEVGPGSREELPFESLWDPVEAPV